MRRVVFNDRAAGRFRRSLGEGMRARWTRRDGSLVISVGIFALVAHAAETSGCFAGGQVRTVTPTVTRMESKMKMNLGSAGFLVVSALASGSALGQACNELVVWGVNNHGGLDNIPIAPMVAVSSNYHLSVGLDSSGQIHCWGAPDLRASVPSVKGVAQVVAGNNWGIARDVGGAVFAWGDNSKGQCNVPAGTYTDVACGDWHNVAVATDGSIRCWGDNAMGACNSPAGVFAAVGAGSWHSLAITSAGSVVGWGYDVGQLQAPVGVVFSTVVGGWKHSIGLSLEGSIHGWGVDIGGGLTQIPQSGTYTAIDCSASRGIALRDDGTVVTWGSPTGNEWPLPRGRFVAISAGGTVETGLRCACRSDLVADSTVNGADMAIVLNFWGTDGSQFPGVDIDGDGIVNGADLAAVLNAWGPCPQ